MQDVAVSIVSPVDEERAIAVAVMAFSSDPVLRWLLPDPAQFLEVFPTLTRVFAGGALRHNTAWVVEGYRAVAFWLPPEIHPDEEQLGALMVASIPEARHEEVFGVLEQMGSLHPAEPHWYLPMIAVDPRYQGRGYGSALLRHALDRCDREGRVAYLESSNPRNNPLYERHGFAVVGEIQAGDSPTIWSMARQPGGAQSS